MEVFIWRIKVVVITIMELKRIIIITIKGCIERLISIAMGPLQSHFGLYLDQSQYLEA